VRSNQRQLWHKDFQAPISDLECKRQFVNEFSIQLDRYIASHLCPCRLQKSNVIFVSIQAVSQRVEQEFHVAETARTVNDTNLKLWLVEPCPRRYRKVTTVSRAFADHRKGGWVFPIAYLNLKLFRPPARQLTQSRIPERSLTEHAFQAWPDGIDNRSVQSDTCH